MRRFSSARLSCVLPILFALLQWSHATDVTIDVYEITDPADLTTITYNAATLTSIEFAVEVSASGVGGLVEGIDVYFVDINGDELGTVQPAVNTAFPVTVATDADNFPIEQNTVDLKFDDEDDCRDAEKLCVLIKGSGVDDTGAEHCLDLGTDTGEAGGKDCADPTTTAAPTGPTRDTATTDADTTTGEGESGAGAAYLMWSVLSILLLATQTLTAN